MANLLAPNIVRAVVREVMVSKNAVLDAILDNLVAELTPIISEHANVMLMASIDPDPREALLDEVSCMLLTLENKLLCLEEETDKEIFLTSWPSTCNSLITRINCMQRHLSARRRELRGEANAVQGVEPVQGGDA